MTVISINNIASLLCINASPSVGFGAAPNIRRSIPPRTLRGSGVKRNQIAGSSRDLQRRIVFCGELPFGLFEEAGFYPSLCS
jgi:hypothetical protein